MEVPEFRDLENHCRHLMATSELLERNYRELVKRARTVRIPEFWDRHNRKWAEHIQLHELLQKDSVDPGALRIYLGDAVYI